jgi:protein OS-9
MLPISLLTLVFCAAESYALRSSTIPEDVYAFPKYKIHFLNGRPLLNLTAQRWLHDGLTSQEEFLGVPKSPPSSPLSLKEIASSQHALAPATDPLPSSQTAPVLQQMRLGAAEYLCLLLPPPEITAPLEDSQQTPKPMHTWELLQPLEGTCLYVSKSL